MAIQKFSIGEAISFGWKTLENNVGFFILLVLLLGLFFFISDIIYLISGFLFFWCVGGGEVEIPPGEQIPASVIGGVILVELIGIVLWMIVWLGVIRISLNFCDNVKSRIVDLFSQYRLFFKYLLATILYVLLVGFGLIFLIFPGIYLGVRYMFYEYFIVDKKAGIIESLKRSWGITRGKFWNLFLFVLLVIGIFLLGLLCLVIGLFAAIPIIIVAFAFIYRKLLAQTEGREVPQPL